MGYQTQQPARRGVWALAERQHGVVTRAQLLAAGIGPHRVKHRLARGRLHPIHRGVYAVGRPRLTRHGLWMAAVLACGPSAVLSHESAAALWGLRPQGRPEIEVSVRTGRARTRRRIVVHRRANLGARDVTVRDRIPVTTPICTLVDIALALDREELEAAINAADRRELVGPDRLRRALNELPRRPGVANLREALDRRTFTLTDSALERRFLPLARDAGLGQPLTGVRLNGFKVDFYWPDLGLVVETDGLRYHRTPAQQATDRLRDQAHTAAGLTSLRFTHAQVRYQPGHVRSTLAATAGRLRTASGRSAPPRSGSSA
ncbi:MAG: type IV toxin-antitoxin system AbiEi family antitoxin domain-containing protein [Solirubrobacterales bacterium]